MSPRPRKRNRHAAGTERIPCIIKLWILRMLVPLGGHQEFISKRELQNEGLARLLGLGDWIDCEYEEFKPRAIYGQLRAEYRKAEQSRQDVHQSKIMTDNVARLSALAGLSDYECRILEFAVSIHGFPLLDDTADFLGDLSSDKAIRVLSVVLDLPEPDVRSALSHGGALAGSGLVRLDSGSACLRSKLDLLSSGFADTVMSSVADPVTLLQNIVVPGRPATLSFDDFIHIESALRVLRPFLKNTIDAKRTGVNILVYGPPGTGKSELARILAMEADCELFEVASEDEDGDPISGKWRLKAFRAAQNFFSSRRALLVFDEVEDVLTDEGGFFLNERRRQTCKGWVTRMLEMNPLPTIWVTNSIQSVDQAVIRRFDMVMELPVPPKRQRERIVRLACGAILPEESIRRIAKSEQLSPAVVNRAAATVQSIRKELGEEMIPGAVEQLISSTLVAQGHDSIRKNYTGQFPAIYDPTFINADADLVALANGLAHVRSGRVCLYGPPGTGKTAFGQWLADRLNVPLNVKRASDLLSMWVGGTEQNIARAFHEAEHEGALLLIDEVDSFLQDRRRAQHSWEVTAVNEMLTQMESFPEVFIASTNLMDGLDQAALRRFDIKLKFDFMKAGQSWMLLQSHCVALALPQPGPDQKVKLARLGNLTPGDFAAVIRRNRFSPLNNADAFLDALEKECLVKENGQRKNFGFC